MLELIMAVIFAIQDSFKLCTGICGICFYFVFVIPFGLLIIAFLGILAIIEFIVQTLREDRVNNYN